MPKKVITRRQRKAAEAKRKAEEDARLKSQNIAGNMESEGPAKVSAGESTHVNPSPEENASSLPLRLSHRQKKKAKERLRKNIEKASAKEANMKPSLLSSRKSTTKMVDAMSKMNSDTSSTWYDGYKTQPPATFAPINEQHTIDSKRSAEQSNRMLPFGTRLCRRIARRFRSVSVASRPCREKQDIDVNQPTLHQLAALNRVILNKKQRHFQEDMLGKLKQRVKNPLAKLIHSPVQQHEQQREPVEFEMENQAAEILDKYLQSYQDGDDDDQEPAPKRQKKAKLKPTRFPPSPYSKEKGTQRQVNGIPMAASFAPYPLPVSMVQEPPPPLKIVGHTGYFILTGTNEQLAQQLNDLAAQHVSVRQCLLLLAGMTEKVEQQLENLDQNRDYILEHMHNKHALLAPKRQRRQKRPSKYTQVDKAGRANANRKGNPKKQRCTILAPAAERSSATC